MSPPPDRVAGWDLLRGLCALTVAVYHLLYWLQLAQLPALGTYGVYLFFVLSGASLAWTYGGRDLRAWPAWRDFLLLRGLRLAPLFVPLTLLFAWMLVAHRGSWPPGLGGYLLQNLLFVFGLHDPVRTAVLIGAWSLGIEVVFYLMFPLLLASLAQAWLRWALLLALAAVQAGWIAHTLGRQGWEAGVVAYHQVPAFAAYFQAGCMIGWWQRRHAPAWPLSAGLGAIVALGLLLGLLMPQAAGQEIAGWRGLVLAPACVAAVAVVGAAQVRTAWLRRLASFAGDVTYGTYLLHPVLLWGLAWWVLPLESLTPAGRWTTLGTVLAASVALAWCSERWLEAPLRRQGRAWLQAWRGSRTQRESASIAS